MLVDRTIKVRKFCWSWEWGEVLTQISDVQYLSYLKHFTSDYSIRHHYPDYGDGVTFASSYWPADSEWQKAENCLIVSDECPVFTQLTLLQAESSVFWLEPRLIQILCIGGIGWPESILVDSDWVSCPALPSPLSLQWPSSVCLSLQCTVNFTPRWSLVNWHYEQINVELRTEDDMNSQESKTFIGGQIKSSESEGWKVVHIIFVLRGRCHLKV